MADTAVKDGGSWRTSSEVHIKDGGSWRSSSTIHIKDGGTWREVFSSGAPGVFTVPSGVSGPGELDFNSTAYNQQGATQFNMTALGDFTNLRIRAWGGGGQPQQGYPSGAGGFGGGYISGSAGDVLTVATNFGVVGPAPGGGAYGIFVDSKSQPNARIVAGGGGATEADDGGRGQVAGAGGGTSGQPGRGYQSTSGGGPGYTSFPLVGGPGAGYGGGSGGGSGYWGGQGGPDICCLAATGGGGGNTYIHPSVGTPQNQGGNRTSVANAPDPIRGSAGNTGTQGRMYINGPA
jgi:hypothetical protein